MKTNASNATYAYEAPALPATMDDLFAQMNSEGARGYLALSYYDNMALPVMLYVKDQTQTAIFSYQSSAPGATLLDQGNNYGAQGFAYWGSMVDIPSVSGSGAWYYVKAGNCSGGWMCTAPMPTNVAYMSAGPAPRPVTGP